VGLYQTEVQRGDPCTGCRTDAEATRDRGNACHGFFFAGLSKIRKEYSGLFDEGRATDEGTGRKGIEPFIKEFGWLYSVHNLTNGRRELWSFYLDMNVIELLNTMSFFKLMGQYERQLEKKANGKGVQKR
jgi:hypothetical protein